MQNQNMSDIIEAYLKQVLTAHEQIEIRRSEMANQFNCVPSQINYVINTRFTIQQGYLVESKRGGGGYIRIIKVKLLDKAEMLDAMIQIIGDKISQKDAYSIVQKLYEDDMLTKREATLTLSAMEKPVLTLCGKLENELRAQILIAFLNNLRYE
ncbi:CtsR family transcriptional regulator [Carnobacterium maltaromaticum]|uniref:CtsR family transcriptional regulator n=1 Tax=Carnobacterium maltaromaticum TaxID=2751 RepID=UPI000704FDBC|nr:CtsR family transcriptional regulator [Carnobacterium maltaromaticum]KRN84229.1 transcriptional regulator [Carnobacterium maltaromaticum]MDT1943336.1 CtsR family transcriptional regulator [Carnobacterium maltaromaticum]MDT1998716.1 CtsR family transcriptional regulator [Carnobacterium maltaromaticum]TFJ24801.1 CtsR family transcriptional regulator [Carnobacterium maltaromaticum]TFJ30206.1 CtsR family transcriptional regulator [Carnobacterium maltaromaticum]